MTEPRTPELTPPLNDPWLLAVWPGMGNVALAAGAYLTESLDLIRLEPGFPLEPHFDLDRVPIKDGLIVPPRLPRNDLFAWRNPDGGRDLLLFVAEAQPSRDGQGYARALAERARQLGATRVITFAAMVSPSLPSPTPDRFAVATDYELLEAVRQAAGGRLATLKEGEISGMNGVFLAAAAALGLPGACTLADVPALAVNLPYLPGSLALLRLFSTLAELDLDLDGLARQAEKVVRGLSELQRRLGTAMEAAEAQQGEGHGQAEPLEPWQRGRQAAAEEEDEDEDEEPPTARGLAADAASAEVAAEDLAAIEALFIQAEQDRSRALDLKAELDRHGVFKRYEDRFLDLFKNSA